VSGIDLAPVTITAKQPVYEVKAGEKLTVPLILKRTSEFSGDKVPMRAIGALFERAPGFDLPINADKSEVVFDLKALNVPPGEYRVSLLGGGVVKYRHQPEQVASAEAAAKKMQVEVKTLEAEVQKAAAEAQNAPAEKREQMAKTLATVNAKMKAATETLNSAQQRLAKAKAEAQPRDIADIIVCEPFTIRVKPVEKK
jgi:hypothetical protein